MRNLQVKKLKISLVPGNVHFLKFPPKIRDMANFTLEAVYDYNICTYYLLPLIKLNKFSFGPKNFRQCYVDRPGKRLYVRVSYASQGIEFVKHYLGNQWYKGHLYLIFELPDNWSDDVLLFKNGEFSKMSNAAKEMIRTYGGMHYKNMHERSGKPFTDARLMAIDDDPSLRASLRHALEKELDVRIPEEQELIQAPNDSNFIDTVIQEHTINTESLLR